MGKKDKNIISAKLIFGRFGLHRRGGSSPDAIGTSSDQISKENKATGTIADIRKKYILTVKAMRLLC